MKPQEIQHTAALGRKQFNWFSSVIFVGCVMLHFCWFNLARCLFWLSNCSTPQLPIAPRLQEAFAKFMTSAIQIDLPWSALCIRLVPLKQTSMVYPQMLGVQGTREATSETVKPVSGFVDSCNRLQLSKPTTQQPELWNPHIWNGQVRDYRLNEHMVNTYM
jgi:hypothetical protein